MSAVIAEQRASQHERPDVGNGDDAAPMPAEAAEGEDWGEPVDKYNRFLVGVAVRPRPEDREVKNMMHLVAYDICDHSRLRRVAKTCEGYGIRVEKSVFECDLPYEVFQRFWCRLIDLIDEDEDAVVAYRICRSCMEKIESMGVVSRPSKPLLYCV